jgi:hypothetical protein
MVSLAAFALTARASLPDPVLVGTAVGALALMILFRPRLYVIEPALAGTLAGVLASAIRAQGLPLPVAIAAACAIPCAAAYFASRDAAFADPEIRDEALVFLAVLGLVTGAAPGIAAGWNSAGGMNVVDNRVLPPAMPAWVLALGGGSAAVGGLFTLWRRS